MMNSVNPSLEPPVPAPHKPVRDRRATATAALAGLLLAACGGAPEALNGGNPPQSPLNGGNNPTAPYQTVSLGKPNTLPALADILNPGPSATGDQFTVSPAPVNVSVAGTAGRFSPDWNPLGIPATYDTAWALYMLELSGTPLDDEVTLNWLDMPDHSDVWIGLADFVGNRWVWSQVQDATGFSVPNLSNYIRPSDSAFGIVIMVAGDDGATLSMVTTPTAARGAAEGGFLNDDAPMGTNLEAIDDAARSVVFTDVMRTARDWIPQNVPFDGTWNTGDPLNLGPDGWPASLDPGKAAATVLMNGQQGNYPAGQYVCLYDGTGSVAFRGDATVVSSQPGRIVVDIVPTTSLTVLSITATDVWDPVRNVRLVMPGFEGSYQEQPFHPDFLDSLTPFSVLRFMDWGKTNNSTVATWADRTTTATFSQALPSGVAVEHMIELCNTTLSDMWVCVPHLADDTYVTNLATLIRDELDPRLHVYVEYSNEVWNGTFAQSGHARSEGLTAGLSADPFTAQLRWYSQRSTEVFALFDAVFVDDPEVPVMVLAGQSTNPWTGTTIMDWDAAAEDADCYAVAPYFGNALGLPANEASTQVMSVPDVLADCDLDSTTKHTTHTSSNAANASSRELRLIAYEGGQHLVGVNGVQNNATITDLFLDSNRDTGMRQLYLDDLRRWDSNGGELFMAFTLTWAPTKYGAWGILESQNQVRTTAPKWMGIQDFLAEKAGE
jgi:hypothetical protein